MAKPVLITHLGFLFPFSAVKTVQAFNEAGFSYARILWNLKPLLAIVDNYKRGVIDTPLFMTQICAYFPNTVITEERFFECWNAGITIDFDTLRDFFKNSHQKEVAVLFTSNTNPAHTAYIQQKVSEWQDQNPTELPRLNLEQCAVFSYKEKNFSVLQIAIERLKQNGHSTQEISVLTKTPDETPFSWGEWFNPLKHYERSEARRQYAFYQHTAASQQCRTYAWEARNTFQTLFNTISEQVAVPEVPMPVPALIAAPQDAPNAAPPAPLVQDRCLLWPLL